jgi:hypothetical protein
MFVGHEYLVSAFRMRGPSELASSRLVIDLCATGFVEIHDRARADIANQNADVSDRDAPLIEENDVCCSWFHRLQDHRAIVAHEDVDNVGITDQQGIEWPLEQQRRRGTDFQNDRPIRGPGQGRRHREQSQCETRYERATRCGNRCALAVFMATKHGTGPSVGLTMMGFCIRRSRANGPQLAATITDLFVATAKFSAGTPRLFASTWRGAFAIQSISELSE